MPERTCGKCGALFSYERARGGRKLCDSCSNRKTQSAYRRRNPDKARATYAKWLAANPERARELRRQSDERNADEIRERAKRAWADPETRAKKQEWHRQWSRRNAAKVSARVVQWQKDNPAQTNERNRRRRARKAGAAICDFTEVQWLELLAEHDHRCFYCGESGSPLEREHKIPLARGGDHTKANIVPSCVPCNRTKGTMTAEEFYVCMGDLASQG